MAIDRLHRDQVFAAGMYPVHSNRFWLDEPVLPHAHDFCEIAIILSGHTDYRTQHRTRPLAAGDVVAVRPGNWHEFRTADRLDVVNTYIGAELFASDLGWVLDYPGLTNLIFGTGELSARLSAPALARVRRWLEELAGCHHHAAVDHALQQRSLLGCVFAELAGGHSPTTRSRQPVDPAARSALSAMAEEPERSWQVDDLAAISGVSPSHLQHQFASQLGISLIGWLNRYRAEQMAVQLVAGNRTVAEIGRAVGWLDPNYAARRFRNAYQMSPTDYRRRFAFDTTDSGPEETESQDWA